MECLRVKLLTVNETGFRVVANILFVAEILASFLIIRKVPYTEIDWSTYMQQVTIYAKGERNYSRIGGDTGPIVYPGGHLHVYHLFSLLTNQGSAIQTAQYIFLVLYMLNLVLVFRLYFKSKEIAPIALVFVTLTGYRIHSIFLLRLFNDPIAMLLFYFAADLFTSQKWLRGCIIYSLAVSIKMNVLLFSPALFFLLLTNCGVVSTVWHIFACAMVQLLIALPFLSVDPFSYISRSFDLQRVFFYKWTVNWRFLPQDLFLDKRFHAGLLFAHIVCVFLFAFFMWFKSHGGLLRSIKQLKHGIRTRIGASESLYALFTANVLGIVFARSLHYQFYSWYYHQLPFLLFRNFAVSQWSTGSAIQFAWRAAILLIVEYSWNVYPSTVFSSTLLMLAHAAIIAHLLVSRETGGKPLKLKLF